MFFRMLKKDLKENIGLNIIIFLFMIFVSALAAASVLLIYINARGVSSSQERCKTSEIMFEFLQNFSNPEADKDYVEQLIKDNYPNAETDFQESIRIAYKNFYFQGMDYDFFALDSDNHSFFLTTQPRVMNLVYDSNDQPFYVENGHIAIPKLLAMETGLGIGDSFYITTQMGRQYEFVVSALIKDPTAEFRYRLILSDEDYALIREDSPYRRWLCGVNLHDDLVDNFDLVYVLNSDEFLKDRLGVYTGGDPHISSDFALTYQIISIYLLIACFFMLLIILFAVSFMIRAVIKNEEYELGVMKALGTDSFSFRWLFAAKYIAFSIAGGLIGLFVGIFAGRKIIDVFYYNISFAFHTQDYIFAVFASMISTVIVICFVLSAMRRINKISVIDIISGGIRAERLRGSGRFELSRHKKTGVPLFLALSDLFGKIRRYALLLCAFTVGSIVVIMCILVRDSVISTDFLHQYYGKKELDYMLNVDAAFFDEICPGSDDIKMFEEKINQRFEDKGLPASIESMYVHYGKILPEDHNEAAVMSVMYYNFDPTGLCIRSGGQYPKLQNEILIDYYFARQYGLNIGDGVTLEYLKYSDDRTESSLVREEYIITGFLDRVFQDVCEIIMSASFSDAVPDVGTIVSFDIQAEGAEKDAYAEQIRAMFPNNFVEEKEIAHNYLKAYDVLFGIMRNAIIVLITLVLAFLTYMYQTIYMQEEEREISMLRCCGFDDRSIKRWQFLRIAILFLVANALSLALMPGCINWIIGRIIQFITHLSAWSFIHGWGKAALWIVFIAMFLTVLMQFVLKKVETIKIKTYE